MDHPGTSRRLGETVPKPAKMMDCHRGPDTPKLWQWREDRPAPPHQQICGFVSVPFERVAILVGCGTPLVCARSALTWWIATPHKAKNVQVPVQAPGEYWISGAALDPPLDFGLAPDHSPAFDLQCGGVLGHQGLPRSCWGSGVIPRSSAIASCCFPFTLVTSFPPSVRLGRLSINGCPKKNHSRLMCHSGPQSRPRPPIR